MSSQPSVCQSRCVAYSSDKKQLAVADNEGGVTIRDINWADVDACKPGSLDGGEKPKKVFKKGDVKKPEWIECMAFSPDNKRLAIGSHDNTIYICDTKTYKITHKLTGHSSFITAIDWS